MPATGSLNEKHYLDLPAGKNTSILSKSLSHDPQDATVLQVSVRAFSFT